MKICYIVIQIFQNIAIFGLRGRKFLYIT